MWVLEEPACEQGQDTPSSSPGSMDCQSMHQGKPNVTLLFTHISRAHLSVGHLPYARHPPGLTGASRLTLLMRNRAEGAGR